MNRKYFKVWVLGLVFIFLIPSFALAATTCPYGLTNDSYPGECGRYVDQDKNGVCDLSQVAVNTSNNQPETKNENEVLIPEKRKIKAIYNFLPLSLVLLIAYGITYLLAGKKIISLVWHRRIWNLVLLFSFLASGLLGIFLVLKINYGFNWNWPLNILYWHVETGISMVVVSIFHISWHLKYYACGFSF
jgi:hypothetical protein